MKRKIFVILLSLLLLIPMLAFSVSAGTVVIDAESADDLPEPSEQYEGYTFRVVNKCYTCKQKIEYVLMCMEDWNTEYGVRFNLNVRGNTNYYLVFEDSISSTVSISYYEPGDVLRGTASVSYIDFTSGSEVVRKSLFNGLLSLDFRYDGTYFSMSIAEDDEVFVTSTSTEGYDESLLVDTRTAYIWEESDALAPAPSQLEGITPSITHGVGGIISALTKPIPEGFNALFVKDTDTGELTNFAMISLYLIGFGLSAALAKLLASRIG